MNRYSSTRCNPKNTCVWTSERQSDKFVTWCNQDWHWHHMVGVCFKKPTGNKSPKRPRHLKLYSCALKDTQSALTHVDMINMLPNLQPYTCSVQTETERRSWSAHVQYISSVQHLYILERYFEVICNPYMLFDETGSEILRQQHKSLLHGVAQRPHMDHKLDVEKQHRCQSWESAILIFKHQVFAKNKLGHIQSSLAIMPDTWPIRCSHHVRIELSLIVGKSRVARKSNQCKHNYHSIARATWYLPEGPFK